MEQLLQEIINQIKDKETCLIAIDGRCASGKTTLAFQLQEYLNCDVIHIDDFFMPIQKRSENFMNIIGDRTGSFYKRNHLSFTKTRKDSIQKI